MVPDELSRANDDRGRAARLVKAADAESDESDGIAFSRGIDPDEVGTDVFLARAHCRPGTRIPPHWHTEDTVAYLASGKAVFRSGDDLEDIHPMAPGDWLFVPAGMIHVEETPEDSAGDFLYARSGKGGQTTYVDQAT